MKVLATLLLLCFPSIALAFHAGTACDGCHTSHNSQAGQGMTVNALPAGVANPYLLIGRDASATCLGCHERRGASAPDGYLVSTSDADMPAGTPPAQLTPGGDFGWLKKNYSWTSGTGVLMASAGESHGHNIIAPDYGYVMDTTLSQAPGGSYPASALQCTSCHDPHNLYRILSDGSESVGGLPIGELGSSGAAPTTQSAVGSYRMLGGAGYTVKANPGFAFINKSPAAVSPADYNRPESSAQTRVAYGSGMSEWCANCHPQFLRDANDTSSTHFHKASINATLGLEIAAAYTNYVKNSGDPPYLSLVPFETGDKNDAAGRAAMSALAKNDDTRLDGPSATSNVECLTCHRAHATGWDNSLRWNQKSDYIVYQGLYPGIDTGAPVDYSEGRTSVETSKAYYDKPAASYVSSNQGPLCHKCHT